MSAVYSKNIHSGSAHAGSPLAVHSQTSGCAQPARWLCMANPVAVHSQRLCMVAVHSQPSGCVYCKNISLISTALLCI